VAITICHVTRGQPRGCLCVAWAIALAGVACAPASSQRSPVEARGGATWRTPPSWIQAASDLGPTGSSPTLEDSGFDWSAATLRLARLGCYGSCPEYELSIYPDGRVEYQGMAFVSACGKRVAWLSASRRRRIERAFRSSHYLSNDFLSPSDRMPMTDMDTAITMVESRGRHRAIRHYAPSMSAPSLRFLENLIDKMVRSAAWVTCTTGECSCPSPINFDEPPGDGSSP